MVHDHLWAQAGTTDGFLCIGCLERRLGRRLQSRDFARLDGPRLMAHKTGS